MGLTNKDQRLLFEAVYASISGPQQIEESTEVINEGNFEEIESIVMDYLQNAISNNVNESTTEEEVSSQIVEAVENLNILCGLVNEYFGYRG